LKVFKAREAPAAHQAAQGGEPVCHGRCGEGRSPFPPEVGAPITRTDLFGWVIGADPLADGVTSMNLPRSNVTAGSFAAWRRVHAQNVFGWI